MATRSNSQHRIAGHSHRGQRLHHYADRSADPIIRLDHLQRGHDLDRAAPDSVMFYIPYDDPKD
jgi:hypothetical protein